MRRWAVFLGTLDCIVQLLNESAQKSVKSWCQVSGASPLPRGHVMKNILLIYDDVQVVESVHGVMGTGVEQNTTQTVRTGGTIENFRRSITAWIAFK